ncbi:MAG: putative TetR family transcriptional regulator [Devosia sp.]|nr:putative TetR family transcriptional regulator [Devosia sp.]
MSADVPASGDDTGQPAAKTRAPRADAQRNLDALLRAAMAVFSCSGVEAPVREIADKAGVGVGTLYRHFPQRVDLVVAVFRNEIDACADAAPALAAVHSPSEALGLWMQRYVDFLNAKRGLAAALHSGNPAFDPLPAYFCERLRPALRSLLDAAAGAGEIRGDIDPDDLLEAVGGLSRSAPNGDLTQARRMVSLLVDGLRYGAGPKA